jgi:uncharacterized protein
MSMLAEACSTERPVHIFEFGGGPAAMRGPRSSDRRARQWWRWSELRDQGIRGLPYAWAIGLPALRLNRSRDIRLVQDRFIASGRANWLGDGRDDEIRPAPLDDVHRAAVELRKLMGMAPGSSVARHSKSAYPVSGEPHLRNSSGVATVKIRRPA